MRNRAPLSPADKEHIYQGKLSGQTLTTLATEVDCSLETVRKWWRRGRQSGLEGLRQRRRGRRPRGMLSQFDPRVVQQAETDKRGHPGWGAERVLIELRQDPLLVGLRLPRRSRLASFFKLRCPDCLRKPASHRPAFPPGKLPPVVHAVWEMDCQEGIALADGETAIICNIRDPYGAAPIASRAFAGKRTTRPRKLTVAEYREVLRAGFQEWQTLPESVWTDNELRLIGNPSSDFPSLLTLYLVGLDIRHVFIRPGRPTDHAQVERGHRTLDGWVFGETGLPDLEHLQQALDHERLVYLFEYPCQASDCDGRPPLVAHPELLHPRRFYTPELEPSLFCLQRVYTYLATFTFERKISAYGCVSLTYQVSIGRKYGRLPNRMAWVRCNPKTREWIVYQKPEHPEDPLVELARRPIRHLDFQTLTGLEPAPLVPAQPVQLPLPLPV